MTKIKPHLNPKKSAHVPAPKLLTNIQPSEYIKGKAKRLDQDSREVSPYEAADLALCQKVANHIELHYKGHAWAVNVDHAQGVVMISIPLFMGSTNYYVVPLSVLKTDPGYRSITEACGHILERYNLPRGDFNQEAFMDLLGRFPRHRRGTAHGHIPD